jgi:zinc transport system substrate-binding protein
LVKGRGIKDIGMAVGVALLIIFGGVLSFSVVAKPSPVLGKIEVMTSFYPLHFFSSQIGGDKAVVFQLIPDNAEPHSWEPKPSDLVRTDKASLFVYNGGGFESWADDFLATLTNKDLVIVDTSHNLTLLSNSEEANGKDPHFWLDPLSAKVQVQNILEGFVKADPVNEAYYQANADHLKADLDKLDLDFQKGLENRTKNDFITTHEGFNYLANRYGLIAHGAVGISADQQPSPQDMVRLSELVRQLDLHYVFSEPVFSDAVINTIASETGAQVLILDGVHGREGVHVGMDYFQIMYENLHSLRIGLEVPGA